MYKDKYLLLLSSFVIFLITFSLFLFQFSNFKKFEFGLYDTLLSFVEQSPQTGAVVIADIDERSLSENGQWPWSRDIVASFLNKLLQMQVLSTGLDFVFAEPDRTSINTISKSFKQQHQIDLPLEKIPPALLDNDKLMSEVLSSGNFVLGYGFVFSEKSKQYIPLNASSIPTTTIEINRPLTVIYKYDEGAEEVKLDWYEAKHKIGNIELFAQSSMAAGYFNVQTEVDGAIRKVPLIVKYKEQLYPNLSLATLMQAVGINQVIIKVDSFGERTLVIADQEIPLDDKGNMWVHFRAIDTSAFESIPVTDILHDRIPPTYLENKIILLGSSAMGLHDIRATPYNSSIAGVEVHATIIDNILRGDYISHPVYIKGMELFAIFIATVISLWSVVNLKAITSLIVHFTLAGCFIILSFWSLSQGIYFSVFYALVLILMHYVVLSVMQYRLKEINLFKQVLETNKAQEIALKNEKEKKIIEIAHTKIKDSINYASLIQNALLPDEEYLSNYFQDNFFFWEPKDTVGGDIYFISELKTRNEVIIMIIDGTGHGVPGAFVTMLVKAIQTQILADISNEKIESNPAIILSHFNKTIKTMLHQEEGASSNAGFDGGILIYSKNEECIKFSGARTAMFYTTGEKIKVVKGDRQSIGYITSDPDFVFKENRLQAQPGMSLYITTDGLLDQTGGEKNFSFGKKRFTKLLEEVQSLSMNEQKALIVNAVTEYQGQGERCDDMTITGLKL